MQRCSHSLSTASALRSIFFPTSNQTCISTFLAPSYATDVPQHRALYQQSRSQSSYRGSPYPPSQSSTSRAPSAYGQNSRRKPPSTGQIDALLRKFEAPGVRRPKDEGIESEKILLLGEKKGDAPRYAYRRQTLEAMDRETYFLVQVGLEGRKNAQEHLDSEPLPVCKIMERKEYFLEEQGKSKKSVGGPAKKVKELEFSWGVDQNDLNHRLGKAEDFLVEGKKVEIFLAPKRRGKAVTEEDARELVKHIKERLLKGTSVKESKEMEGIVGKTLKLFFESKV